MPHSRPPELHADTPLRLVTLGGASLGCVSPEGTAVTLLGPGKPLALLIYLAFSPGRAASREHLIDLLWSDLEPERGKHALRQTIYFLRHHLGEHALASRAGELQLTLPVEADRDAFLASMERGDLEATVAGYTGPFLPGFASPGGAEFEHWADLERERLRGIFVRAAETLARRRLATSNVRDAQRLARRVRDEDPLDESGWRLLIETLVSSNEHLAAAIEADALSALLQSEGREPEPATRASLRLARQRPASDVPAGEGAATGRGLVAELVGREREFAMVIRAWEDSRRGVARHVHVSGAAGLGKTRLLTDVLGRLRATGAVVVSLRASPGDRRVAYALAGELARALGTLPGAAAVSPAAASALIALHPALSSQFAGAMDQSTGDEALRRRTMAVSEVLAAVADESPVALLIDDLHWTDPASQQLLLGVLDRMSGTHVLVVTAARPTRDEVVEISSTEPCTLRPLSSEQVGVLLGSLGALPREDWVHSLTVALHATSGGVPLLVLETLQLALDRGSLTLGPDGWHCDDPVYLVTELQAGSALRHRVAQLDAESRGALLLLGTAGAPVATGRVARAMERSPEDVEALLGTLERRGFVLRSTSDWEPAHDQIAEIVQEIASPEERRRTHLALGRVLADDAETEPMLLPRAGHHLAAAGTDDELVPVFQHFVRTAERRGDRRTSEALAAELLGEHASRPRIDALARSLPLRRRVAGRKRRLAAAAAGGVAAAAIAVAAVGLPDPARTSEVLLLAVTPAAGDSGIVTAVRLDRGALDGTEALPVGGGARTSVVPQWSRLVSMPQPGPDGETMAWAATTPDSGAIDLFVHSARGGDPRRVTRAAGDDDDPSWSPDGRQLVFSTARWGARGAEESDLATADLAPPGAPVGAPVVVRRLTETTATEREPRWSPDGTRIAFTSRHDDLSPTRLCWTTLDRALARCLEPGGYEVVSLIGWLDSHRVLALADSVDRQLLLGLNLTNGQMAVVDAGPVSEADLSPDGQWVACFCQRQDAASAAWYVYPVAEPERARRVAGPASARRLTLRWGVARPTPYLDRLHIVPPAVGISADASYRLRVEGAGPDGAPLALPAGVLLWSSRDTGVAVVDSLGAVHPRRAGRVRVHVSAGGWRQDSLDIVIGPSRARQLLNESWRSPNDGTWSYFGSPRPVRTAIPSASRTAARRDTLGTALVLRVREGIAGAYTSRRFAGQAGLGLEVPVSLRVGQPRDQLLHVGLAPGVDTVAAGGGRRRALLASELSACGVTYPGGEGMPALDRLILATAGTPRRVPAPAGAAEGRWFRLRIQIFPDGSCGYAIDGVPVLRSSAVLSPAGPFHLLFHAAGPGASMQVGAVEMWEGVRGGVEWDGLDRE